MKTLLTNVLIYDGTGNTPYKGEILVEDEYIVATASALPQTSVDLIVDCEGDAIAPGFIDTHTHSDISIIAAPEATGKISQGITTDIIGNCGLSAYPITDLNREHLQKLYAQYNIPLTWNSFTEYKEQVNKAKPSINIAALMGHNTLRSAFAGYDDVAVSADHLTAMCGELENALNNGIKGFSTGLVYSPGKFAEYKELQNLLRIVSRNNAVYTSHIRNEGDELIESLQEAIKHSRDADIGKLHISHLKASQKPNWEKMKVALELLNKESGELRITADRYPYTESMTQLSIILPPPYDSMPDAQIEHELFSRVKFAKLVEELATYDAERWENIRLVNTEYQPLKLFIGESFHMISRQTGYPPHQLCAYAIRENSTGTMAAFKGMSPPNLDLLMMTDFVCCGSDETARPANYSIGRSHPRGFGSMPRFITRQLELGLQLEESIRRITSLPAEIFGLYRRGLIRQGFYADLVIFNPKKLSDTATFGKPHSLSQGIEKVWVNGTLSFTRGSVTPNRAGRVI